MLQSVVEELHLFVCEYYFGQVDGPGVELVVLRAIVCFSPVL
jgi:hypothetical protein